MSNVMSLKEGQKKLWRRQLAKVKSDLYASLRKVTNLQIVQLEDLLRGREDDGVTYEEFKAMHKAAQKHIEAALQEIGIDEYLARED